MKLTIQDNNLIDAILLLQKAYSNLNKGWADQGSRLWCGRATILHAIRILASQLSRPAYESIKITTDGVKC